MPDTTMADVVFSDEIREWLADNDVSMEDILKEAGIGGAISAVFLAVSRVLNTWLRHPIYDSWEALEEIRDRRG